MGLKLVQPAFTGGEVSPSLAARVDLARYGVSLKRCRNFIIRPTGGIDNRPGTRFIAQIEGDVPALLIPFEYSSEQAYVLEFTEQKIRIIREGVLLMDGPDPLEVVTPYLEAELPRIRYTQSADVLTLVHPNHAPRQLLRFSDSVWQLRLFDFEEGPFQELNTELGDRVWANAELGETTLETNFGLFQADHVGSLFYMEPQELRAVRPWEAGERDVPLNELRRSDGKVYRCVSIPDILLIDFTYPLPDPLPAITGKRWYQTGTVRPTHDKGRAFDGPQDIRTTGDDQYIQGVEWRYEHGGYGIVRIDAFISPTEVEVTVLTKLPSDVVGGPDTPIRVDVGIVGDGTNELDVSALSFSSLEAADYVLAYDDGFETPIDIVQVKPGPILVADVNLPIGVLLIVTQFGGGEMSSAYTDVWAFGAWNEVEGYPSVCGYYADRKVFANTPVQPQTLWMSRVGQYNNFGKSVPLVDDDALTATINARKVNEIRALIPLDNLLVMTVGCEWRVTAGQDGVLTPSSLALRPQCFFGSSWVEPEIVGAGALYIQERGGRVRDIGYQFDIDGYSGNDMTIFADHLVERNSIIRMAYAQQPSSLVMAVRDDGEMMCMTYVKEQEVIAWSTWDTAGDVIEDVATIPEGTRDAIYLLVRRTIAGVQRRYIERLESRLFDRIEDAVFMDSALSFDGTNTSTATIRLTSTEGWGANTIVTVTGPAAFFAGVSDVGDQIWLADGDDWLRLTIETPVSDTVALARAEREVPAAWQAVDRSDWAWARDTVSGLAHLNGREVVILADGHTEEPLTVVAGAITLPQPARIAHVGLQIIADIETLEVNVPGEQSVRDRKKAFSKVTLVTLGSRNIKVGRSVNRLEEWKPREQEFYDDPPNLNDEIAEVWITSSWSTRGRFVVRQDKPLPLTILNVIPEVTVGG